jgi:hypothetical protein
MFDFFRKQKWILVKTFKLTKPSSSVPHAGVYTYHIHCFESAKGNREVEYVLDGKKYDPHKGDKPWILTTDLYQMQIYRWLNGRRDPEIPTYEQIPEDDTATFLRGKVN